MLNLTPEQIEEIQKMTPEQLQELKDIQAKRIRVSQLVSSQTDNLNNYIVTGQIDEMLDQIEQLLHGILQSIQTKKQEQEPIETIEPVEEHTEEYEEPDLEATQ